MKKILAEGSGSGICFFPGSGSVLEKSWIRMIESETMYTYICTFIENTRNILLKNPNDKKKNVNSPFNDTLDLSMSWFESLGQPSPYASTLKTKYLSRILDPWYLYSTRNHIDSYVKKKMHVYVN